MHGTVLYSTPISCTVLYCTVLCFDFNTCITCITDWTQIAQAASHIHVSRRSMVQQHSNMMRGTAPFLIVCHTVVQCSGNTQTESFVATVQKCLEIARYTWFSLTWHLASVKQATSVSRETRDQEGHTLSVRRQNSRWGTNHPPSCTDSLRTRDRQEAKAYLESHGCYQTCRRKGRSPTKGRAH